MEGVKHDMIYRARGKHCFPYLQQIEKYMLVVNDLHISPSVGHTIPRLISHTIRVSSGYRLPQ